MLQLPFTIEQFETYIMIFIRVGAIIFSVPLFGSSDVPKTAKIGLSLCIALILYPAIPVPKELFSMKVIQLVPSMIAEVLIGVLIGLTARLFFEGVQLSGQLVGFQMGFGVASVFDPLSGATFSVLSQIQNLLATLLFLILNMHHWFFRAMALSFEKIPIFHCYVSNQLIQQWVDLMSIVFVVGLKIAAPIMAVLVFSDFALGILNKAAPMIQVFLLSFPLKIAGGLFVLAMTLPMFYVVLKKTFFIYEDYIQLIIKGGTAP
ncbi:MAG: flagellar biosynthetic protein FliR [Pseudomonadota bacterium]